MDPISVKCVVSGDSGVGKTSLINALHGNPFQEYLPAHFDVMAMHVTVDDQKYMFSPWDTNGHEEFDRLRPMGYPETDIFLLVFSVISRSSLENLKTKWVIETQQHCPGIPFIVVATKCDLRNDEEIKEKLSAKGLYMVTKEEGEKVAKELGAVKYLECSSLTGEGVKTVLEEAIHCSRKQAANKACCIIL